MHVTRFVVVIVIVRVYIITRWHDACLYTEPMLIHFFDNLFGVSCIGESFNWFLSSMCLTG